MKQGTVTSVERSLLSMYLDKQEPRTVKEIATEVRMGETIVRRALRESPKVIITTKDVKIMSRNYPGTLHQHRSVDAFMPSRRFLVEVIKNDRREADWQRYERTFSR